MNVLGPINGAITNTVKSAPGVRTVVGLIGKALYTGQNCLTRPVGDCLARRKVRQIEGDLVFQINEKILPAFVEKLEEKFDQQVEELEERCKVNEHTAKYTGLINGLTGGLRE